jgi:hypothetical protein
MLKKIKIAAGITVFVFALALNLQFGFSGYGIKGGNVEMLKAFATTSSSSSGALLGVKTESTCDPSYDKVTTEETTITSTVQLSQTITVTGNVVVKVVFDLMSQTTTNGVITYTYKKKTETRIKAKQVRCPGYAGFCSEVDCGEF